jgi:acyl-CoA:acyl-CoA alkyltransferase
MLRGHQVSGLPMYYSNVCLEAVAYTLPDEIVTSAELESRLAPLYRRLRLPEGRLELMTGICQRRLWPVGALTGPQSAATAEKAIAAAGIDKRQIGALVHGSVCRDYVEPATACGVHQRLGLDAGCLLYDLSNACLGLLDGIIHVANMIELGQIRAGLIVGTENSRGLVEATIEELNTNTALSRNDIKPAVASLTIGSGSAAILLVDRQLSRTGNRLLGGAFRTNSAGCLLCHSDGDPTAGPSSGPLMFTDSEGLMQEGVKLAKETFADFLAEVGWGDRQPAVQKTFCHQVGRIHRNLLMTSLGLDPAIDFTTLEFLGNTGAVALPMTAAIGIERGHLSAGDRLALLGIGSGINVVMLGIEWQRAISS